jgi:HD superfamily phosphodiesterase
MSKFTKKEEKNMINSKSELKSVSVEDVKNYIDFCKEYKKMIKEINFDYFKDSIHCGDDICEMLTSDYPDDSHNFEHHVSVKYLAIEIFNNSSKELKQLEKFDCTILICISSILHDVIDYKYPKNLELKRQIIENYLKSYYPDSFQNILWIIDNMSYSKEARGETKEHSDKLVNFALKCVTDTDRFFAIGLVGIQRCIQYTIMNLREKQIEITYESVIKNVVTHCNEKLLLLRDKFKIKYTKSISLKHHQVLEEFVKLHS